VSFVLFVVIDSVSFPKPIHHKGHEEHEGGKETRNPFRNPVRNI